MTKLQRPRPLDEAERAIAERVVRGLATIDDVERLAGDYSDFVHRMRWAGLTPYEFPMGEGYWNPGTKPEEPLPVSCRWMVIAGDARWITEPTGWGFGVPGIALDAELVAREWTWRIWETWDFPDHGMPTLWIREIGTPTADHVAAMQACEHRAAEISDERHVARRAMFADHATVRDTSVTVAALFARLAACDPLPTAAQALGVDLADAQRLLRQAATVADREALRTQPLRPPATDDGT